LTINLGEEIVVTARRTSAASTSSEKNSSRTRPNRRSTTLPDDRAEEYAKEVAERIVTARKAQGLTQVELAELVGVSPRSMQGYENAEVIPYRKMKDLARVLNRPVEWLLHGDEAIAPADVRLEGIEEKLDEILKKMNEKKR
jgi:transcriptional regulator with XRE-family HTH domain